MTKLSNSTDCSQRRIIVYWFTTAIVAAEFAVGGVMDILRLPPFSAILEHLGYPGYFSVILGVWKVLGAVAVLAPRFPRLKEWAYAGMVFNMTGAVASHLAVGDPAVTLIAPLIFTGLVAASWLLRPLARRDDLAASAAFSRSRAIAYWVTTGLLALECGVGGVMGALRIAPFSEIMKHLGLLYDHHRRLVCARCGGVACSTLSPAQGVGLRRHGLHLHGSSRLPPRGG
jgi:uncharacterized membrane protein YphA (DoxX/SURF4 family)